MGRRKQGIVFVDRWLPSSQKREKSEKRKKKTRGSKMKNRFFFSLSFSLLHSLPTSSTPKAQRRTLHPCYPRLFSNKMRAKIHKKGKEEENASPPPP